MKKSTFKKGLCALALALSVMPSWSLLKAAEYPGMSQYNSNLAFNWGGGGDYDRDRDHDRGRGHDRDRDRGRDRDRRRHCYWEPERCYQQRECNYYGCRIVTRCVPPHEVCR